MFLLRYYLYVIGRGVMKQLVLSIASASLILSGETAIAATTAGEVIVSQKAGEELVYQDMTPLTNTLLARAVADIPFETIFRATEISVPELNADAEPEIDDSPAAISRAIEFILRGEDLTTLPGSILETGLVQTDLLDVSFLKKRHPDLRTAMRL